MDTQAKPDKTVDEPTDEELRENYFKLFEAEDAESLEEFKPF